MKATNDWVEFILNQPLEAPPGLRYSFNTGGGVLLASIIENASGVAFDAFLKESIFDPLTISSASIEQDPTGTYNGGDGYSVSLLDWTKLAYLFIKDGIWKGRTVIDPNFIAESFTSQFKISGNQEVGYLWTLFGDNYSDQLGVPHDEIYFILGEKGSAIFLLPEQDMVVTILADNFFGSSIQSLNLLTEITFSIR